MSIAYVGRYCLECEKITFQRVIFKGSEIDFICTECPNKKENVHEDFRGSIFTDPALPGS